MAQQPMQHNLGGFFEWLAQNMPAAPTRTPTHPTLAYRPELFGEVPPAPPIAGKDQAQLPAEAGAPVSPSQTVLAPDGIPPRPAPQPETQTPREQEIDRKTSAPPQDVGQSIAGPQPTPTPVPRQMVSNSDAIRTMMLQAGLNLMVPQWGGPLEQVAMAFGGGAEAVGRQQAALDEQANVGMEAEKSRAQIDAINALTDQRQQAAQTSKSKRLTGNQVKKSSTEFERLANELGLGAKGKLKLKVGLKSLEDPLLSDEERNLMFETILAEAQEADSGEAAAPSSQAPASGLKVGEIRKGKDGNFKYLGGDPKKQASWQKVP